MAYKVLRDRSTFRRTVTAGHSRSGRFARVFWLDNGLKENYYGVAATIATGGAVERNRVRRWSRELLRRWDEAITQGNNLVVMSNRNQAAESYGEFTVALRETLVRAGLAQAPMLLALETGGPSVRQCQSD